MRDLDADVTARQEAALNELDAAIAHYRTAFSEYMRDRGAVGWSHFEVPQLAVAQAFLRFVGIPATPDEVHQEITEIELKDAAQRAARSLSRKTPIPTYLRWQVFERDNFTCQHCGARRYLEVDHIIPESKGGPTTLANFQTLCGDCNRKKGAR